jgi:predicted membrane chloride channel (bestrophin family)
LPFVLAGALRWWTLLPVLLVSYTFFGLEPNDLPPALAPSAYVLT